MKNGRKTLADFEEQHGGSKIAALEGALKAQAESRHKINLEIPCADNTITFGAIGDTHYGSLYEAKDECAAMYERFRAEGITDVLHAGDVLEGHRLYRGQEFEIHKHGWAAQRDWFAKVAPKVKGITTHFITGNHDASMKKAAGIDVGSELSDRRPDWNFIGEDHGTVEFTTPNGRNFRVLLLHPAGGSSYALCFDDTTEVLTKERGFLLFRDLTNTDEVATRGPDGEFQWQKPTAYTDQLYCGEMLHFKARTFDLMVTPDHRMLVRRYEAAVNYSRLAPEDITHPTKSHPTVNLNWIYVPAKDLVNARRQEWQMTRVAESWVGSSPDRVTIPNREPKRWASAPIRHFGDLAIEDAAELIAWYVTEGYIDRKRKCLVICQSARVNPGNHAEILDLLRRIGFENVRTSGKDQKNIAVSSVELCDWLVTECGSGSANKHLPSWLKDCDEDVLSLVFQTMIKGDGWINGVSWCYRSISKALRDDVSEMAVKLGFGVTSYGDTLSLSKVQNYPTINRAPEKAHYNGRIYCVTVPNGNVLVRRGGRTVFSGNSYRPQKITEQIEGGTKPNMILIGNYHKAEWMPNYRNVSVVQIGAFQWQTPFMLTKGLAAHVGGWIVRVTVQDNETPSNSVQAEFTSFFSAKV